jgi:hypothetical protein
LRKYEKERRKTRAMSFEKFIIGMQIMFHGFFDDGKFAPGFV